MAGKQQRGLSFITVLIVVGFLAAVGVMVSRTLPSILEYQAIVKAVDRAAAEGGTPQDVRRSFQRATEVDMITSITPKDLQIAKEGDRTVVSFAYQREFHMFGPAWLTLKYAGSSRSP